MKKLIAFFIIISLLMPSVFAEGEETTGDYFGGMGRKIGRGLWNVISSPAEIPCTMKNEISDRGAGAGIFTGLGLGITYMLRRILVGVTEVGTFLIPMEATIPPVCSKSTVA